VAGAGAMLALFAALLRSWRPAPQAITTSA
jgi:hypothetical protein